VNMISMLSKSLRSEEPVSGHVNIASHYDDVTLMDKSGKLIQIIKLNGIDSISKSERELDAYKNRMNNLLKGFSSEFALYFWEIRTRSDDYPAGVQE
jgi:type IV secretory pathway VirB4 component